MFELGRQIIELAAWTVNLAVCVKGVTSPEILSSVVVTLEKGVNYSQEPDCSLIKSFSL